MNLPIGITSFPVGAGTQVERAEPTIAIREGRLTNGATWVRITQTVTLSVELPCLPGRCEVCRIESLIPVGREAAEYLLANNDGSRFSVPVAEDAKPERDRYPVKGWRRVQIGDLEVLACGKCVARLQGEAERMTKEARP